jgi:hypothetical protein
MLGMSSGFDYIAEEFSVNKDVRDIRIEAGGEIKIKKTTGRTYVNIFHNREKPAPIIDYSNAAKKLTIDTVSYTSPFFETIKNFIYALFGEVDYSSVELYLPEKEYNKFRFENISGNIISELPAKDVKVLTEAGEVSLTNLNGRHLNVSTYSGNIILSGYSAATRLSTWQGDIIMENTNAKKGAAINIDAGEGDTSLKLPPTAGLNMKAYSDGGELQYSINNKKDSYLKWNRIKNLKIPGEHMFNVEFYNSVGELNIEN